MRKQMATKPNFVVLPSEVFISRKVSNLAVVLYAYLCYQQADKDECKLTVRQIANDFQCSRRTIQRAIAELRHAGFAERGEYDPNFEGKCPLKVRYDL
jgi:predicted DNA-binding transcriptional regulator YafY